MSNLNILLRNSPNFNKKIRLKKDVKCIVIHYTGMQSEVAAINRLSNPRSKVSCHYLISQKGQIIKMVDEKHEAWHAGKSKWKKVKSLNKYSIGIEISNPGHDKNYKNFSNKQLLSLKKILHFLIKKYKIKLENILGHSDIAPTRKKDPGEKFPWKDLSKKKLCLWHTIRLDKLIKFRNQKISGIKRRLFFRNLSKIGYDTANLNKNSKYIIKAFQRRFRPELINSNLDEEVYLISKNLISK